jgi:predicted anti-sigma-YlaC factor YlaD
VKHMPNNDAHQQARKLIALSGAEILSANQLSDQQSSNAWLAAHLETCASCRTFAENAADTIHGLRAIPIAAGRGLVSTTQIRVRRRALELQRQRERMWLVAVSCTAVTLCALLSTVAFWLGFAWLGARAQLASSVWQVGFLVFCVMPALVAAILLLAKAKDKDKDKDNDNDNYKHLAHHTGSYQG